MYIHITIHIPNWKSRRFLIPIPKPSQCGDSPSKQERVRTIPTEIDLFVTSNPYLNNSWYYLFNVSKTNSSHSHSKKIKKFERCHMLHQKTPLTLILLISLNSFIPLFLRFFPFIISWSIYLNFLLIFMISKNLTNFYYIYIYIYKLYYIMYYVLYIIYYIIYNNIVILIWKTSQHPRWKLPSQGLKLWIDKVIFNK